MKETDNDSNTFDKRAKKDEASFLDTGMGVDKLSLEQRARKEKLFLLSEETKDVDGQMADWRHFNFMVDEHGANYVTHPSVVSLLRAFWSDLWQYISPLLKSYENLSASWHNTMEDMDEILKSHADLKLEHDLMQEYLEKHIPNVLRCKYRHWAKAKRAEIDEKIKHLQTQEGLAQEEKRIREKEESQ